MKSTSAHLGNNKNLEGKAVNSSKNTWKTALQSLGPGIIIAALVFGPSKITITTMLGSKFNYSMLWIVFVAIFFMIT